MRFRKYNRVRSRSLKRDEILSIELAAAFDLSDERSFAGALAAFNSAGQGPSLLDHDEDFARAVVKGLDWKSFTRLTNRGARFNRFPVQDL